MLGQSDFYYLLNIYYFGAEQRSSFLGQVGGYDGNGIGSPVDPFAMSLPLPPAFALFATGLVGLGLLGWRRKKAAAG